VTALRGERGRGRGKTSSKADISRILDSIESLKPFPAVVQKAIPMLGQAEVPVQDVIEVIKYDPGITANVLRLCNSAHLGLRHQIKSLNHAMLYLGSQNLLKIIIASGVTQKLAAPRPGYCLDRGGLWRHSVSAAIMASVLAQQLELAEEATLFTAALLHDIGKLVLDQYVGDALAKIMELVNNRGYAFQEAEQEVLGMDHATVGSEIARRWHFPEPIRKAIARHHIEPDCQTEDDLVMLVHLADLLVLMVGADLGADGLAYRGYPTVMRHFGMRERHVEKVLAVYWHEVQKAEEFFLAEG